MTQNASPVWFITGCSTGFGYELAKLVLARGWRAVVTARDRARVAELVGGAEDRALALALDVTDPAQIAAALAESQEKFGRIDVLVNNATRRSGRSSMPTCSGCSRSPARCCR